VQVALVSFHSLFIFSRLVRPLVSHLFPYTTLFRSMLSPCCCSEVSGAARDGRGRGASHRVGRGPGRDPAGQLSSMMSSGSVVTRSEEHTSELQSRFDLVCRLLLEKKKMETIDRKEI